MRRMRSETSANLAYARKLDQKFGEILGRIRQGGGKANQQHVEEVMALFHCQKQDAAEKLMCCLGDPHPCRAST